MNGIKAIFVPEVGYIGDSFNSLLDELRFKFKYDEYLASIQIFDNERPVEDVKEDYAIPGVGSFNLTFLDVSFFRDGVAYFRPLIRGFLVLLMIFYHIKQLVGFFGYDAGYIQGRSDWGDYMKNSVGGHKDE